MTEITDLSYNLKLAAGLGLEALDFIIEEKAGSKAWQKKAKGILEKASEQGGRTELMVIDPIGLLVRSISY